MFEGEIERKISDFRELGIPNYVRREGIIHMVDHTVSTVVGARRAGKSFRVMQLGTELISEQKIPSLRAICHLDFDNPILAGISAEKLPLIQKVFLKLTPELGIKSPILFLLDEIHKIRGWEHYVVDLSRNPNWKVIVTGSSSKMLREEIATELRGKAVSTEVYPLSFSEFLKFKEFRQNPLSTGGQAGIARLFDEYLSWGSYPAMPKTEDFSREALLREYFDTMILRDIIQRYSPSKPRQCIELYRYLLSNISRPHTLKGAYGYLKSKGYATSRDSVREYIHWAEDSRLIFSTPIYSQSHKEQERNYHKIYSIDWALALHNSSVWDGSISRSLENMVFLYLQKQYSRIYYYLTKSDRKEVDFITVDQKGNPVMAVQVCENLNTAETAEREVSALAAASVYFGISEALIITLNEERTIQRNGITIRVVPAAKWLLENPQDNPS